MDEERITESPSWTEPRGQVMKTPDDVAEMFRPRGCGGHEADRAAARLQPSYGKELRGGGGVQPFKSPQRGKPRDGLEGWLGERFSG
jgi:hypothetical protein